ncbi:MAG: helix-turn-helix transcriptional regulator [Planctomycetota bacterium]|nr:helix-turn-helix transcriptional regulator [Planctomycetota bacterium]
MDPRGHFLAVLARAKARAARFNVEPGVLAEHPEAAPLEHPRLSLCLRGRAGYRMRRRGASDAAWLAPGEALFTLPGCLSRPHPDARYESLGLVFHPHFVHLMHARQTGPRRAPGRHRMLAVLHAPSSHDEDLRAFVEALRRAAGPAGLADPRYARGLLELLLRRVRALVEKPAPAAGGKAALAYEAACRYLREHDRPGLGRAELARILDLHPNHLSRLFKRRGGATFNAYLTRLRLERARALLAEPALTVEQVARTVGFASTPYFIARYRRMYGQTPGRARGADRITEG